MDSIQNILMGQASRRQEPPEIIVIKDYVLDNFKENVQVAMREREIIITCSSAALAGSVRMHIAKLKAACQTDKRLVIKIG